MKCEPACTIIQLLGGLASVARAADTSTTSVQRWRMPYEKGGTGGFIPRRHHGKLIALGKSRGVELSVAAFIDQSALPKDQSVVTDENLTAETA